MRHDYKERETYIYALYDPREPDKIRYVGKTIDLTKRFYMHLRGCNYEKCKHFPLYGWIRQLLSENIKPEFKILETTNPKLAINKEKFWIGYYSSHFLLNQNIDEEKPLQVTGKLASDYDFSLVSCPICDKMLLHVAKNNYKIQISLRCPDCLTLLDIVTLGIK